MNNRIRYIDALKGALIYYVLYFHVLIYGFSDASCLTLKVFNLIAMPCFFFVSGYLCRIKESATFFLKKLYNILLPTLFTLILYALVNNLKHQSENFDLLHNYYFDLFWKGYWFGATLFVIFCFHYLCQKCCPERFKNVLYFSFLVIPIVISHYTWQFLQPWTNMFCLKQAIEYFPYFSLGYLISRNNSLFDTIMSCEIFRFLCFAIPSIYLISDNLHLSIAGYIFFSFSRFFALLACFMTFYSHASTWDKSGLVTDFFVYVGKNSLPIYLLHFFFLPCSLQYIFPYIQDDALIQVLVIGLCALLLLTFVLGIIYLFSCSQWLSFVFGISSIKELHKKSSVN